jgi:lipopolysaccharide/colanic/teichoic acid biosynthesis glycosyltransferase
MKSQYALLKRLTDAFLSFNFLIINIPLILFLSVLIKLTSRGPVFYTQARVGRDGKPFNIIKFRTMRADAEDGTGPVWAKSEDHRITTLGHYLRRLHMDEIPQFVNVLKGDMSFIGPRPERPFFVDTFKRQIQGYTHRLLVKPGLTGLAQVRYRYDESIDDVEKKLTYDLFYIKKMSLSLDCMILFWTGVKITSKLLELFFTRRIEHDSGRGLVSILLEYFRQRAYSA